MTSGQEMEQVYSYKPWSPQGYILPRHSLFVQKVLVNTS